MGFGFSLGGRRWVPRPILRHGGQIVGVAHLAEVGAVVEFRFVSAGGFVRHVEPFAGCQVVRQVAVQMPQSKNLVVGRKR